MSQIKVISFDAEGTLVTPDFSQVIWHEAIPALYAQKKGIGLAPAKRIIAEVEGDMPENKEKCLDIINKYLSLPDEERLNFGLGRRAGYYEKLADLDNSDKHYKIAEVMTHVRSHGESVDSAIFKLKDSFI